MERRFVLKIQSAMAGKERQQELETAGHTVSIARTPAQVMMLPKFLG